MTDYAAIIAALRGLSVELYDNNWKGGAARVWEAADALTGAREAAIHECIEIVRAHEGHIQTTCCISCILDQLSALSLPTTEPAKAEEGR